MRLYSGTSKQFLTDTTQNQIAGKLLESFEHQYRYKPSNAEVQSWQNSLRAVALVFQDSELLDHGVILEYQLPMTSLRLDCLITGHDRQERPNAVVMELKQWSRSEHCDGENEVLTWVGKAERQVLHPSVQVGRYGSYLRDSHSAFYETENPISLATCAYLHNYSPSPEDPLLADKFDSARTASPVFAAGDVSALSEFLSGRLETGNGSPILNRIEEGAFRPSKMLMDHVGNVIKGNSEFILLDEQLIVYDNVIASVKKAFHQNQKQVILVKGGPGTGKSVIAINLMADLLLGGYNTHYATGSRAFTETLRKVIGRRGAIQFKYFNSYMDAARDDVDVLICDEAHRIRKTSHNRFTPKAKRTDRPQIEELVEAGRVSVFFIDDLQTVRPEEIGSSTYIKEQVGQDGHQISEYELEVQFRCAGSDGFVNWVDNTLGIRRTANILWTGEEDFDFEIFSDPETLEKAIRTKAYEGHRARMTAGFCWEWSKKPNPDGTLREDVVVGDWKRPWNARPEATRLASGIPKATLWANDPGGIDQVGCVYTAQGFEFDYVGVIFGTDLVYDLDAQEWKGNKENCKDSVVRRSKEKFADLVKNTYRVLLSRGLKGCYVCFLDKDTERFVRSRVEGV